MEPVRYCVETDTMAIELRPWPGRDDDDAIGRDAGDDLVIHYALRTAPPGCGKSNTLCAIPNTSLPRLRNCAGYSVFVGVYGRRARAEK